MATTATIRERNYGLDCLRILSMFMVVVLHVLGAGGILDTLTPGGIRYVSAWGLEVAATCAVNCYGLLSGYVGYGHSHSRKKLFSLWLHVVFWGVVLTWGLGLVCQGRLSSEDIFFPLLPVLTARHWYFTAYFALALFMPYLDRMLSGLNRRQTLELMGLLAALFCLGPLLTGLDPFVTGGGYSFLWLAVLYLLGAGIGKCEPFAPRPAWQYALTFVLCVGLGLGGKLGGDLLSQRYFPTWDLGPRLMAYTSPCMLLAALSLLLLFRGWRVQGPMARRLIGFFAPVAFGVYLIHTNPKVWAYLLGGRLAWVAQLRAPLLLLTALGAALAIFIVCALMDFLRLQLFALCRRVFHRRKDVTPCPK